MGPMTARQIIEELEKVPGDVVVELSMCVEVVTSYKKTDFDGKAMVTEKITHELFPKGKVYGVSITTGGRNKAVISGS